MPQNNQKRYRDELDGISATDAFKENTKQRLLEQLQNVPEPEESKIRWFTPRRAASIAAAAVVVFGVFAVARWVFPPELSSLAGGDAAQSAAAMQEAVEEGERFEEADKGIGEAAPQQADSAVVQVQGEAAAEEEPAATESGDTASEPPLVLDDQAAYLFPDPSARESSPVLWGVAAIVIVLLAVSTLCFFGIRRMFRSSRFSKASLFPLPGDAKGSGGNVVSTTSDPTTTEEMQTGGPLDEEDEISHPEKSSKEEKGKWDKP